MCVHLCVCSTWKNATTRSATQRLSMNWCSGLWCPLRLSSTTSTSPLPSSAITKMTANTTTSPTARRASRSQSVTFVPAGVTEAIDQSMEGSMSVTMETDMLAWMERKKRGGEEKRGRAEEMLKKSLKEKFCGSPRFVLLYFPFFIAAKILLFSLNTCYSYMPRLITRCFSHYISYFRSFLSSSHASPDALMLNVCDNLKGEMFLYVLSLKIKINSLETLLD